ncbi:ATP-dependent DNA helicase RecG [Metallumcola ferriviriculae]|uniref:ATP-dependent DNA helicase RecG n=1 Tax=Metallumcola ferriviriculae TaxID=3039180 RepID=A0AAU0USE3_9FIRM|nr:ATP-dependent DNA helicase RecG [Desulfitibacteraceae bacterium MK1]
MLDTVLKEMKQALIREKKGAYSDAGVFGGFAMFLKEQCILLRNEANWSETEKAILDELVNLSDVYYRSDHQTRAEVLARVSTLLNKITLPPETVERPVIGHWGQGNFIWQEVAVIKGVGTKRRQQLQRLGIKKVFDLIYHVPRRYLDRSTMKRFRQLNVGVEETLRVKVRSVELLQPRKRLNILKALVYDGENYGVAVWFNQSYLRAKLRPGLELIITGKVQLSSGRWEVIVTDYEILNAAEDEPVHTARIVPVYGVTEGISQRIMRQLIFQTLNLIPYYKDFLPEELRTKYNLIDWRQALWQIHFPDDWSSLKRARQRLVYEELFLMQMAVSQRYIRSERRSGIAHTNEGQLWHDFVQSLPFTFTRAQRRVLNEIRKDMGQAQPMTRLLQGDVGSGKTIVATAAAVKAVANDYQVAVMAPTEILARQHCESLNALFEDLNIRVSLVSGSLSAKEKAKIYRDIQRGEIDVVVGTHALIQETVQFHRLGLAVVDEQHRFGVMQRDELLNKGDNADLLVMTATPIPRTLSLTLYGDLQVSVIDELPPGRQKVITRWVGEERREKVLSFIGQEMNADRQVYVVCPLVSESEKLDLAAAEETAHLLMDRFKDFNVGLVHGKMKSTEKEMYMQGFYRGEINLLVSTTVIEVGVDVPNATVMMVEGAERFGLAQLHQLRGRIGRGEHRSYCILMGDPKTEVARERLQVMEKSDDGFVIAEEDLRLRGPGEIFGTRQHGLPEFKVADLIRDAEVVQQTFDDARKLVQNKSNYQLGIFSELIALRFGNAKIS